MIVRPMLHKIMVAAPSLLALRLLALRLLTLGLFTLSLSAINFCLADTQVNIVGLYSNKAVLMINGAKPQILSVGQISEGVKLLAANSAFATLQIDGKTRQFGMGQGASIAGKAVDARPHVVLYANTQGHFVSECQINGATLTFIVDTGATTVALNSGDAKFANIDYKRGQPMQVSTANGVITAYQVIIAKLQLGNVTLNNVNASVVEGGSPSIVLLGMSALNRLEMKRQDIAMTLTKKY